MRKLSIVFVIVVVLLGIGILSGTDASARCRPWPDCRGEDPPPLPLPYIPVNLISLSSVPAVLERQCIPRDLWYTVILSGDARGVRYDSLRTSAMLTNPDEATHQIQSGRSRYHNSGDVEVFAQANQNSIVDLNDEGNYTITLTLSARGYRDTSFSRNFEISYCD